ncbi:hypothetical protein NDU88_005981 [Pleurodeles waltl]|uniref:Reverse transcriptase domain-containing protein n=1 Tax=Pleurodeles waltl TaxID=8319 RepID=A0AAV7TX49_PLEWA|nr:hypothetical protein NDU88_005981 [Pleurodeles waltl]
MVRQFHNVIMLARVLDDGDSSDAFPLTNGVKQGYALAPTLFNMMFSAMLSDAFCHDEETSIKIRYRTDSMLFNLRRLQAETKVEEDSLHDLLFSDDCAFNTATEAQTQQPTNCLSATCKNFGLTANAKKTQILHQPAPQKMYAEPTITTEGEILKAVDKFTYLCSTPQICEH